MRTAYFHEDDYGQIELVCDDNREWCADQVRRIEEFSNEHRAGIGWTAMYMRPASPVALATRGITMDALEAAVAGFLPPFDTVTTGYSTHVEPMPNTRAFGFPQSVTLFAEQRENVVSAIWFMPLSADETDVRQLASALSALAKWNLLLVDWNGLQIIPLSDADALRDYLTSALR